MISKKYFISICLFFIFLFIIILPLNLQFLKNNILNSPDATSNYVFIKNYGTDHKLYIEEEYSTHDKFNLFHFRSGLTNGDKIVPMSFLGLPLIYGTFYIFLSEYIVFINIILSFLLILFLYKIFIEFDKKNKKYFIISLFLATPLIYYMCLPFMNILPAITFCMMGIYYLIKYTKSDDTRRLILYSTFFSISVLFRYEFLIFNSLIIFMGLLQKHKKVRILLTSLLISLFILIIITLPLLVLNDSLYGSPLTLGSDLFNKAYFEDRVSNESLNLNNIIPNDFNFTQLLINIYKYFILFNPLFFIVFLLGFLSFFIKYKKNKIILSGIILLSIFIIFYQGSENIWGSSQTWGTDKTLNVSLDHSLLRYWLPFFVVSPFLFIIMIRHINLNKKTIFLFLTLILTISITELTSLEKINSFNLADKNELKNNEFSLIFSDIENDSLVFCSLSDKYIIQFSKTLTWWNGPEKYNASQISSSIIELKKRNYQNIYVYRENEVNITEINLFLSNDNLILISKNNNRLYKIENEN